MSHFNTWANPSKAGVEEAVQMAAFLEERSTNPDVQEVNKKFCQMIAAYSGERLLELGCGSGVLCRMLAPLVYPHGFVIGVDISPTMAIEAHKYVHIEELETGIAFGSGLAEALPFPNASFDVALAARLLMHVSEPDVVLSEMIRVVNPGGRVITMDWDFETVTVDHPDRELTRRLLHWRNDHHGGNNWSGRQLWGRLQAAGLQNLSIHPWVVRAHSEAEGLTKSLWRAAQVACEGGAISSAEEEAWIKELKERIQAGTFFASVVYFIVQGNVVASQDLLR